MKVWIINPFDNLPVEGFRPQRYWLMAKAFADAGHEVILWSCTFSHTNKRFRNLSSTQIEEAEKALGGKIKLVPAPAYTENISLKRIFSHKVLARSWLNMARIEDVPDAVIASSPPLGLCAAAERYCRENGVKFFVDIQDAWPETFERVVPKFLLASLRGKARRNYLSAAAVTAVSSRYVDLAKRYGVVNPVRLFYHGIEMTGETTKHSADPEKTVLVYAGNLGDSYDLESVVEGVKRAEWLRLEIAGTGPKEELLRKMADGCERIRFHGYLKDEELRTLFAQSDVGLIPIFHDSFIGVPYKLADYTSSSLAVLNTLEGEVWQMVEEYGAGENYRAGDPESFLAAAEKMRKSDIEKMKERSRVLARKFDASVIYRGYVIFIEKQCSKNVTDKDCVVCTGNCASCAAGCSKAYYTDIKIKSETTK